MVSYKVHRVRFVPYVPQAIHCFAVEGNEQPRVAVSRGDSSIEIWSTKDNWYLERKICGCKGTTVESVVWCGSRLFSSGLHGEISEWDLNKLCVKVSVDSYGGAVWSLAVNHENSLLAAGCEDGCVRLFDVTSQEIAFARVFSKQEGRILSLCWHKDGQVLVAGGSDGTIRVYEVSTGHARLRITMDNLGQRATLVWSVVVTSDFTIISGDSLGKTQFWDGKHGTLIKSFNVHIADVLAICINKQEDTVYSSGVDNKLMQFKLITGEDGNQFWTRSSFTRSHTHDIRALALVDMNRGDATEQLLVSGGVDTNILVYSTKKYGNSKARKIPAYPLTPDIRLSSKAQILMYQTTTALNFWKLGKTVNQDSLDLEENPLHLLQIETKSSSHIMCSTVSDDCHWTAFSDLDHLRLFKLNLEDMGSTSSVQKVKSLPDDILPAHHMKFTSDSSKLITVSNEKSLQIIDITTASLNVETVTFPFDESEIAHRGFDPYSPVTVLAVSPDGTMCACSDSECCINVFDIQHVKHRCRLPRFSNQTTAMAFQPGTNVLAITSTKKEVFMFNIEKLKMTSWSKEAKKTGLPKQWQLIPSKVVSILFDPLAPETMFLQSHDMFVRLDTTKPLPSKRIKLFDIKEDKAKVKNRKRKHKESHGEKSEQDSSQSDSFRVCKKYQPLLFLGISEDRSLVTVEKSWMSIMDSLPPTLHRKRYGT